MIGKDYYLIQTTHVLVVRRVLVGTFHVHVKQNEMPLRWKVCQKVLIVAKDGEWRPLRKMTQGGCIYIG
jgi:hypothetical protein